MLKEIFDRSLVTYLKSGLERLDSKRLSEMQLDHSSVRQICDVPYINDGDSSHLFDIYRSDDMSDKNPVIVNIHGGALVYGSKELNKSFGCELVRRGFTVVNLNYSLLPNTTLYGQLNDLSAAFKFLKTRSSLYGLNLDKMYIVGDSAGALLTYLFASINTDEKLSRDFSISSCELDIKGLGLISIMLDTKRKDILSPISNFVVNKEETPEYLYHYLINPQSLESVLPKTCLITSAEDMLREETLRLHELLSERGTNCTLQDWPHDIDTPLVHIFPVIYPSYPESKIAIDKMCDFFMNS